MSGRKSSLPVQLIEPMQMDPIGDENDSGDGEIGTSHNGENSNVPVPAVLPSNSLNIENPTIDLEVYANSYTGLAKINRLLFIATHCPVLRIEALKLAMSHTKENTFNTAMYTSIHGKLADAIRETGGNPDTVIGPLDSAWIEMRNKKAQLRLEKLDSDLKSYKSNSIKESIRRGHDDLGDHYLDMGDLNLALKCYSRSRDYCTSGRHTLNMCLNVIKVSIHAQNWSHVITYVSKAEAAPAYNSTEPIASKLACAAGLSDLAHKHYKKSAKHFLSANFDHFNVDQPGEFLSPNNVAIYGGLTALATYDRDELYKSVISSSSFKLFLELEPQLREAISKFYQSQYDKCLKILSDIRDNLLLDIYLAPHVNSLYSRIRQKALVQYFSPYTSADMRKMAAAFNSSVAVLEDELMHLILEGQIQARIDSHNKILFAQDVDVRTHTFELALEMGDAWQRRTKALILRSAMLRHGNVMVRSPASVREEASSQASVSSQPAVQSN